MYACMREEEKEWVRERGNSKGRGRTCHVKGTSITATGKGKKRKEKLSGSLAPSLCNALQSFTLSLPQRTQ